MVGPGDTVHALKEGVFAALCSQQVPVSKGQIRLQFAGQELSDDSKSLAECGIEEPMSVIKGTIQESPQAYSNEPTPTELFDRPPTQNAPSIPKEGENYGLQQYSYNQGVAAGDVLGGVPALQLGESVPRPRQEVIDSGAHDKPDSGFPEEELKTTVEEEKQTHEIPDDDPEGAAENAEHSRGQKLSQKMAKARHQGSARGFQRNQWYRRIQSVKMPFDDCVSSIIENRKRDLDAGVLDNVEVCTDSGWIANVRTMKEYHITEPHKQRDIIRGAE